MQQKQQEVLKLSGDHSYQQGQATENEYSEEAHKIQNETGPLLLLQVAHMVQNSLGR